MRVAALLLLIATVAGAQFKSTATLVVAPTTVTDSKGKYVDVTDPADLVLYDNGVRQPIQVDESFNPISLVVAVQTSANSAAILDKLGSSGILFTDLLAGDRGETALVTFSDEVRTKREFTTNSDNLSAGFRSLHVQGDGAVALEAVMQSLAMLGKRKSDRRRILLVIAEKRDRSSKVKFATVLHEAQRQNVLIYWLTYSPFLEPFTAKPKTVKSKDPAKNGELLPPDTAPGNLLSVFTELAHQGKPDNSRAAYSRYRRPVHRISEAGRTGRGDSSDRVGSTPPVHCQLHSAAFQGGRVSQYTDRGEGPSRTDGADARRLLVDALGADDR